MKPTKETILLAVPDAQMRDLLAQFLQADGHTVVLCASQSDVEAQLQKNSLTLVILSERFSSGTGLEYAEVLRQRFPLTPVVFLALRDAPETLRQALRAGVNACLCPPLRPDELRQTVNTALRRLQQAREWLEGEAQRSAVRLQSQVERMENVERVGQSITAKLDLDQVLSAIVDAAVQVTGAEEGSLLLLDHATGELYMRASRNFDAAFAQTFRLPVHDSLAGQVLRTGEPVLLRRDQPQKIKTSYLVRDLVYVPLKQHGAVIGVLGVDNRTQQAPFGEHLLRVLLTLAEYAVIAIENAQLYAQVRSECNQLDTVLTHIHDGVIVVDDEQRLVLVNRTARAALGLDLEQHLEGRAVQDVFVQQDMLNLIEAASSGLTHHGELTQENGQVWSVQATSIPEVGLAITMHDITQLKKMERIKSEFVSTVSHDLRSPLTAILGYVELIERVAPVTDLQHEFIQRVQAGVQNITNLMNNLVNLGRIEADVESRKELLALQQVLEMVLENMQPAIEAKSIHLKLELSDMPPIYANPVQMRQMIEHLLDNALKYTPAEGQVTVRGMVQEEQIILQFEDTGVGIPPTELLFVFDKFYRASNVSSEIAGTGLGLAIVKSIVEKHGGRIWVESIPQQGSTFTVVLPVG
ncbi:MAG: GAF domain-containing protein [Longilinea sp.]|nr:GAF domain-containing protein [Longilinea sp.]